MSRTNKVFELNLEVNAETITKQTNAMIAVAIIRYLSYSRNQIPFVYNTFKSMLETKTKAHSENTEENYTSYILERELSLAKKTVDNIDLITGNLMKEFKHNVVKELAIVFGSTITTPYETYQVSFPLIDVNIALSTSSITPTVHSLMMQLTTCEVPLKPITHTNMFVVLRRSQETELSDSIFQPNAEFSIPRSKAIILINIRRGTRAVCRNIPIFTDFKDLSLEDTEEENTNANLVWCDSPVSVKGYKQIMHKGQLII